MKKKLDKKETELIENEKKINRLPIDQQIQIAKIKSENQELRKYKQVFDSLP